MLTQVGEDSDQLAVPESNTGNTFSQMSFCLRAMDTVSRARMANPCLWLFKLFIQTQTKAPKGIEQCSRIEIFQVI